jgi:hypothetical protein
MTAPRSRQEQWGYRVSACLGVLSWVAVGWLLYALFRHLVALP